MTYEYKPGDVVYCLEGEDGFLQEKSLYTVRLARDINGLLTLDGVKGRWSTARFRLAGVGEIAIFNACRPVPGGVPIRPEHSMILADPDASPLASPGWRWLLQGLRRSAPWSSSTRTACPSSKAASSSTSAGGARSGIQDLKKAKHFLEMLIELEEKAAA